MTHATVMTTQEKENFFANVKDEDLISDGKKDKAVLIKTSLEFAPGWMLVEHENYNQYPFHTQAYLSNGTTVHVLRYGVEGLNTPLPADEIVINEHTIVDYLILYYRFHKLAAEGFRPIIDPTMIQWQDDVTPGTYQTIVNHLKPYPQIEKKTADGGFSLTMACLFQNHLMAVAFAVAPDGGAQIKDRKSLAEDLPVKYLS